MAVTSQRRCINGPLMNRNNMEPYRISKYSCFVSPLLLMPGANCSIVGCNTSRKTTGISIFALPKGEDELSRKTREEWLRQITRNRVIDQDLRRQIEARTLHICKKHFEERFIEKRKSHEYYEYINVFFICIRKILFICHINRCVTKYIVLYNM